MVKRTRIFISLIFLLSSLSMMAQQLSTDEAMSRARAFMQSGNGPRRVPGKALPQLRLAYTQHRTPDEKVCFYVFNCSDNSGFIIMGGDEVAKDVLAYSDCGSFDYDKAPDNFKWWLSQYEEQISEAMDNGGESSRSSSGSRSSMARRASSASRTDIDPLLKTTWNQNDPYNSAIPSLGSGYTGNYALATGCVATAMAQVMKYHNYPATGVGSKSYTKTWTNIGTITFSADFANTTYDWDKMTNSYGSSSSDEEKAAVATLMYHCGVSVNMNYGQIASGGSSASADDAAKALCNNFRYSNAIRSEYRTYFTDDAWENMIYNELKNGRPVFYAGQSTSGGHAFVCDGYQSSDDTYHFNWGWGGYCDCFCQMTGTDALKPGGSGTGGAGEEAAYTGSQQAIINIISKEGGLETPVLRNYQRTLTLSDGSTTVSSYSHTHGTSKTLTVTENVWNQSRSLTSFTLGVKATDTTTGLEYYWPASSSTTLSLASYRDCSVSFDVNDLALNGTYTVQLVARNSSSTSDDDWYEVECSSSVTLPTVTITGAKDPEQADVDFTISNTEVEVSRTIQISPDALYKGAVDYTSDDDDIATVSADGVITGVAPGKVKITAHADGNLYFNETTKEFNITVRAFQKDDVDVSISANGLQAGQTATITVTDGYDGTPQYSTSDAAVATVSDGVVTAVAAGNATITVTIPETSRYNGKTVTFDVNVTADDVYLTETPYFNNDNNPWAGDTQLYYSVKNASTSSQTVYFYLNLYKVTGTGETYLGGNGIYWTATASSTRSSTYDISIFSLTEGTKYRLEFIRKNDWSTTYNIPSIYFTYRSTANVDLKIGTAGYATLILPFGADIPTSDNSGNAIDWKFYECNTHTGSTLNLKEATTIRRNTPYIISGAAQGTYTFTGPKAVDASPELFGDGVLKGTMLETYKFQEGDYIMQNLDGNVAFYKYTADAGEWYATPYKAFIQTDAKSTFTSFNFPDATGIQTAVQTPVRAAGIYSISGVRRTALQPGLNIVIDENGSTRKIFIRK